MKQDVVVKRRGAREAGRDGRAFMSFSTTLIWTAEGALVSGEFGDVYFSSAGGLQESRHVFLSGNGLPGRWAGRGGPLRVAELGFGTGLNFLATWEALDAAGAEVELEYYGIERDPLDAASIRRALAPWPELAARLEDFLDGYASAVGGGTVSFAGGGVRLTLLVGDAAERIADVPEGIDAWYFDGFSPSKNPAMWTPGIFRAAFERSASGATFATFSSAGGVRRALEDAGFTVEKAPGFGRKREMLRGSRPPDGAARAPGRAPWFRARRPVLPDAPRALVVGAGLAGSAAAAALAERGFRVTVIEKGPGPAPEASGNPAALVVPVPGLASDPVTKLTSSAFPVLARRLAWLDTRGTKVTRRLTGALLIARDERMAGRILKSRPGRFELLSAGEASRLAGTAVSGDAIACAFARESGWIDPRDLCRDLLGSFETIETRYGVDGARLARDGAGWALLDGTGGTLARADVVVVAAAGASAGLLAEYGLREILPLSEVRGQLSLLPETRESRRLALPVSFDGFVAPAIGGEHVLGATHDRHLRDTEPRLEQHLGLLSSLERSLPDLARSWRGAPCRGRVGFRSALPDALPAVGPVPDLVAFRRDYGNLWKGWAEGSFPEATLVPGLYLSIGHGWRGVLYSVLAADLLAGLIAGPREGAPGPDVGDALHPARFLIRAFRRQSAEGAAASSAAERRPAFEPRPPANSSSSALA